MENVVLWVGITLVLVAIGLVGFMIYKKSRDKKVEIRHDDIGALAEYVKAEKQAKEDAEKIKEIKRADMKQKLETFKQTKEQLKENLKAKIATKDFKPLDNILKSGDKGGIGIYILYNQTKDKYYVGQAKQLYKRVRDHFAVEQMARDQISGDVFQVKFLLASELGEDYRIDHIEKTGIEIFNSDKNGYNKTTGNL